MGEGVLLIVEGAQNKRLQPCYGPWGGGWGRAGVDIISHHEEKCLQGSPSSPT